MSETLSNASQIETNIDALRGKIVRANGWDQLFKHEELAMADFIYSIVREAKLQYEASKSLIEYRMITHPDGDIHFFERTSGLSSIYQKLTADGNVIMKFNSQEQGPRISVITADIGNIDHTFTTINTLQPDKQSLTRISDEEFTAITGTKKRLFELFSKGKPATKRWEDRMLDSRYLPQRIGHQIFPHFAIEAQAKLMEAYPQLFGNIQYRS